jgi:histidine triad (HIT) family protein
MPSIFTRIIRGEIPCHKVAEDELHIAFLDIRPIKTGHTLVIPKREINYIFDMDDIALGNLMAFAKKVARPLRDLVPCEKVGVMVAGLEVPHVHIHLVPMDHVAELNFRNARAADEAELKALAMQLDSRIRAGA